jgi:16S rRNA G527 N7-methylase RsmG
VFLRQALNTIGRSATILAKRFEEVETPDVSFVTCRALDQFMNKLPELINWSPPGSILLLFGGETLREELTNAKVEFAEFKIPLSERRFVFTLHPVM